MKILPAVVGAEYRGDQKIRLTFNDGVEGTVDFSDWLDGPVFEPLNEPGYFARFFIDGGTVAWPNGADIAPETLHERAKTSEAAVKEALERLEHSRLARECAKLDPAFERALAEEGVDEELDEWPKY